MKIQLALDRLTVEEAIKLAAITKEHIDWIEVGTSLIKEFGMESVRAMKKAFPDKIIVADMKTNDNALYECALCFEAGADVATVMGTSPLITIEASIAEAEKRGKRMMIDLLNTTLEQQRLLCQYDAIFCKHTGKDEQELGEGQTAVQEMPDHVQIAVAGGIVLENLPAFIQMKPDVLIVGSAITKVADPLKAAASFKQKISLEEAK